MVSSPTRPLRVAFASLPALALFLAAQSASADRLVIKRPGVHPSYGFEAEPHLLLGVLGVPGPADGSGMGLGFRGTVQVLDNGFIPKLNNSVGVGFGVDWATYRWDECNGAGCRDHHSSVLWIPVVMQWNFWLSEQWSVFGEPGVAIRRQNEDTDFDTFHVYAGGRWHFSEYASLTMRVGYPTFSVGVSFLL